MKKPTKIALSFVTFPILGAGLLVPILASADHTTAHTIEQLQAQVEMLQARIRALQEQLKEEIVTSQPQPKPTSVPSVCPVFSRTLYQGVSDASAGGEVTKLQQMLAADPAVYPEGLVTGYYGSLTERAVQRWQTKQGLVSSGTPAANGYGVVGPQTRARIIAVCPMPPNPPPTNPPITILSPNGGEQWMIGNIKTIRWISQSLSGHIEIQPMLIENSAPSIVDIDLLSWTPPCTERCPLSSAPNFGVAIARRVPNTGMFSWRVGDNLAGSIVPAGLYVIRVSNSDNVREYDQSDAAFNIVEETSRGEMIIKRVGEREGSFLIQKINRDSVDGLWYQAYPVEQGIGIPKTLYIGDDIGYACEGISEKVTSIDYAGQTVTFTKIVSEPSPYECPICLSANTKIDTPSGHMPVTDLRIGMSVWTTDDAGKRVPAVILKTSKVPAPPTHEMVELVLDDGRSLLASPGHPTVDGRMVGDLMAGDLYDGARVMIARRIPYADAATYDILPSGETGFYWANRVLLDSTLHKESQ